MRGPGIDRHCVRFATFTVDLVSRELWNDGQKVPLQEKPFQILATLLEHPGQLVTREELQHKLWPADTFVDFEHSINTAIKKVRETLGDSGDHPRFIETLPRRGYRFIATVERSGEHRAATQPIADPAGTGTVVDPHPVDVEAYLGSLEAAAHREQSIGQKASHRHRFMLVGAGILVLTAVAASILYRYAQRNAPALTTAPSIAVLPFVDLSPGHDHEYFSDGLAEEILNNLTRIPNLKVAARTSAFQFRGVNEELRLIGQKLNVANLLEGSVQSEGNRVRVTVRLTKADAGLSLWSESYDRDFKDIFAVEDDIAAAVSSALQSRLLGHQSSATLPASRTTNPETYQAFLQARYFARRNDSESVQKAFDYINRAIQFDPNYAPAYALRAVMTAEAAGQMGALELSSAMEKSRRDAEKAIALDPNLAAGYLALSEPQAMADWDWQGAEQSVRKARELAPGDADALRQSGFLAMCRGRLEESAELAKQGLALDPLEPYKYLLLAQDSLYLGRYEAARTALEKAVELSPHAVEVNETRGEVYLVQGRPQEALAEMEKESAGPWQDFGKALAYHAVGRHRDSDAALAHLIAHDQNDAAFQVAQVYAYRGEVDQAFAWLDRACRQRDFGVGRFKGHWLLNNLRGDPRYAQLLRKVNLAE